MRMSSKSFVLRKAAESLILKCDRFTAPWVFKMQGLISFVLHWLTIEAYISDVAAMFSQLFLPRHAVDSSIIGLCRCTALVFSKMPGYNSLMLIFRALYQCCCNHLCLGRRPIVPVSAKDAAQPFLFAKMQGQMWFMVRWHLYLEWGN
jgi:hypothetical protein